MKLRVGAEQHGIAYEVRVQYNTAVLCVAVDTPFRPYSGCGGVCQTGDAIAHTALYTLMHSSTVAGRDPAVLCALASRPRSMLATLGMVTQEYGPFGSGWHVPGDQFANTQDPFGAVQTVGFEGNFQIFLAIGAIEVRGRLVVLLLSPSTSTNTSTSTSTTTTSK